MVTSMRECAARAALVAVVAACAIGVTPAWAGAQQVAGGASVNWGAVDSVMQRRGAEQAGGVRRYGMPRADLRVTVRAGRDAPVTVRPALALGSWLAMMPTEHGVVAMGDLVLLEEEVAPVVARLQAGGVGQTAIHHHLLGETPRLVYVHVHGHGDPLRIAEAVRAAVALTGTPPERAGADAAAGAPGRTDAPELDTASVARVLGRSGRLNGGVYQVSVPRAETVRDSGVVIPPSMGLATAINFQPTGGGRAAITGDFVLTAAEVDPVIRALGEHGIAVTSLHNHLLMDEPRLFFMHFWAQGDAVALARGVRAALDRTNSSRAP